MRWCRCSGSCDPSARTSKPSRMFSVSSIWKAEKGGGTEDTSWPRYVMVTGCAPLRREGGEVGLAEPCRPPRATARAMALAIGPAVERLRSPFHHLSKSRRRAPCRSRPCRDAAARCRDRAAGPPPSGRGSRATSSKKVTFIHVSGTPFSGVLDGGTQHAPPRHAAEALERGHPAPRLPGVANDFGPARQLVLGGLGGIGGQRRGTR